jgi:hypothetical protein
MKRALVALLSAALLSGAVAVSAIAGQPDDEVVCDQKAMQTLLTLGYGVFDGSPFLRCQFRLFIPHDKPHVWTEDEYFHGGDFWFYAPNDSQEWDMSPSAVNRYFQQIEEHLYWGKASAPDASLKELKLSRGPIQRVEWDDGTSSLVRETYFDFAPQKPGHYKWRYVYEDAMGGFSDDVMSEVCIEPVQKNKGKPTCPASAPIDN